MAKIVGLVGTMSGRVGNMVFSKMNGKTIARSYQPQVANPNSLAQVETRSKLKLASQYAAALGDFGRHYLLATGKKVNDRGSLVKELYAITSYQLNSGSLVEGKAVMNAIELTKSGDYPVEAPVITQGDNHEFIATYTPGDVQPGEIVTLVLVAGPSAAPATSVSKLLSRQAVYVGGVGTTPVTMTATINPDPNQYDGVAFSLAAFVLRSRASVDMVLQASANSRYITGADGVDAPGSFKLLSGISASGINRLYSGVGVAVDVINA